ncbi:cell wall-active antibiotics response protein [candidate division KSB1 bacterium]|nr:cell wall-active antibiotics response protein [candidate division KSB1 bacterium]NIR73144.1 cell wall-active antibiotics response protein [candidate division KSB1 bacterium]NIS23847.1 cell wall-active antibiotics response protein [candidate division KSB1 bacterium]NIT70768.1 cell wall-active antibiotics response protein [candidate division KSB1 bacterium]NIU24496.1 cell wall-active antibiotics response protein [candidate division KSB1 bacterium]
MTESAKLNQPRRSGLLWGSILILLGVLFLLDEFNVLDAGDIFSTFWPVILIVIGILLIRNRNRETQKDAQQGNKEAVEALTEDTLRTSKIFGDLDLRVASKNFERGSASTVIGDLDVDFSDIKVGAGEKVFTLNGVIGDINVTAPKHIAFAVRANTILGDLKLLGEKHDGVFVNKTYQSEKYETEKSKLYISISQIIGDIQVS